MNVPWNRPLFTEEEKEAVVKVMESGWITQGDEVERFEDEICKTIGCKYALCVSSGTMALLLCLAYLQRKVRPVNVPVILTSASSFIATISQAYMLGYNYMFVDTDENSMLSKYQRMFHIAKYSNKLIDIVLPVHLMGNSIELTELKEFFPNEFILEDGCQSFGSIDRTGKVGENSNLCVFSFHAGKIITSGEGGCIVTKDYETYRKLKHMRNHSLNEKNIPSHIGTNARMTNLHAAIGRVQLRKIDEFIKHRKKMYLLYREELVSSFEIKFFNTPSNMKLAVKSFMPVKLEKRNELQEYLSVYGIETRRFFPSFNRQRFLQDQKLPLDSCPDAFDLQEKVLMLPLGNGITKEEVLYVCDRIKRFYNEGEG